MQQSNTLRNQIIKHPDHQTFMARNIGRAYVEYWRKYGEFYADCLQYKFKLDEVSRESGGGISAKNYLAFMSATHKTPAENGLHASAMGILAGDIE